jgi:hypothetical protein
MSALDSILEGQILKGFTEVFTDTTGAVFFYFIVLSMFSVLVYTQTQNAAFTAILFIILAGALVGSHLSQFGLSYGLIPEPFQFVILGFLLLALMYVVWQAITKRT